MMNTDPGRRNVVRPLQQVPALSLTGLAGGHCHVASLGRLFHVKQATVQDVLGRCPRSEGWGHGGGERGRRSGGGGGGVVVEACFGRLAERWCHPVHPLYLCCGCASVSI
jgi:hypothetical protein